MADRINSPVVTVLLPVYNAGAYLRAAIDSVLAQSFGDLELLLIDDASTDESMSTIASYHDPRIRVITHGSNQGLVRSLNSGIEEARGRYLARMDADDIMQPARLAEQFAFLEAEPHVAVVATFVEFINADGEVFGTWDMDRAADTEAAITRLMPKTNCIAHPSAMIRRTALGELRYAPDQAGAEDWDLWLRMLSRGARIAKLPKPLLKYRVHAKSMMADEKKQASLEARLLRTRWRYLLAEWSKLRLNVLNWRVAWAQVRTLARMLRGWARRFARDTWRRLTYSPIALMRERVALRRALATWKGEHIFLFPYLNIGGAEQVHADILASVADHDPLVIICGFSTDYGFEQRFRASATVLELPRLLNHPASRAAAQRAIAQHLNSKRPAVLFSSLTTTFFDLLPQLSHHVRTFWLQHAFLHQIAGNAQHKEWLSSFQRVTAYLFVSEHARKQFGAFLFANAIPRSGSQKLRFMPNAVERSSLPTDHDRIGMLFVGRDSAEKRPELFIALADRIERDFPGRFNFTAVGIDQRPNAARVNFPGRVNDPEVLSKLYAGNDILVLTSDREGFPIVIMEAMAHGLAILSTPVGDVPERMDQRFAFVTSSVDGNTVLDEMSEALAGFAGDKEKLRRMRQAAYERALLEFDPATFRARYRALLTSPADPAVSNN